MSSLRGISVQSWLQPSPGNLLDPLDEIGLAGKAERILEAFENEFAVTKAFFR
jgi:hypothetical protein